MGEPIRTYRELQAYRVAFEAAMEVFALSRDWPAAERYALTDQIRRSSRSVCANVAEAWQKRRYPAHFVSKLSDADAEAAETHVWLDFAHRCGYLAPEAHGELCARYEHVGAMLARMMATPEAWTPRPS
jgi:four helix bundle protein